MSSIWETETIKTFLLFKNDYCAYSNATYRCPGQFPQMTEMTSFEVLVKYIYKVH